MKIGYVQNNPVFGETAANIAACRDLLTSVSADLLVFPELFTSGYLFNDREELSDLAEITAQGPATTFMIELAVARQCVIVGGFAERDHDRIYNAAILVKPDGSWRVYRKLHLFDREKLMFDQAEGAFWVERTAVGSIGLMICFDWFFPEAARSLALLGADIIAHPSNLVLPHCPEAMKTRALENRVYTVTANRIGREDRAGRTLTYIGQSRIYAPDGRLLAGADSSSECAHVVELDPGLARVKKVTDNNDLFGDRRPDFYRAVSEFQHLDEKQ